MFDDFILKKYIYISDKANLKKIMNYLEFILRNF